MKNKYSVILALCFSVSLSFLLANQGQNPQWKGTIEEEDGVKVVKNPNEPLYGEITFELEEDLSIGNEEDENYMFYRIGLPVVDSEGNIFVLDMANFRIQKYDREGKYLQTIGRQGQGPGEFEQTRSMCVDKQQNIYVSDMRDLEIFDEDGKYMRIVVTNKRLGPFFGITKEGNIIAHSQSIKPGEMSEEVVLFDGEGKEIKTIVSYKSEAPSFDTGVDYHLGSYYTPRLWIYTINEERAVYGYSSIYKLFVIDTSGELIHIIEKDESLRRLSKKEINKVIDDFIEQQKERTTGPKYSKSELKKSSKFPKNMAFFRGFIADNKGRIYVNKFKSQLDEYEGVDYDIFSKDGYYLYRTKINPIPHIIKNGHIYTTDYNQDTGYFKIKRYKIKNWEQMREGI